MLFEDNVVSNAKSTVSEISLSILFSNIFPASIDTESELKGEIAFAIESALIYSLHFSISGKTENEDVVFPAPFAPAIIYKFGLLFKPTI